MADLLLSLRRKEKRMTIMIPVVFFLGIVAGCMITDRIDQKNLREKFDIGYDTAVDCMSKDGYYIDKFNKTHRGYWIEEL